MDHPQSLLLWYLVHRIHETRPVEELSGFPAAVSLSSSIHNSVVDQVQSLSVSLLFSYNLVSTRIHPTGNLPSRVNHSHCPFSSLIFSSLLLSTTMSLLFSYNLFSLLLSPAPEDRPVG